MFYTAHCFTLYSLDFEYIWRNRFAMFSILRYRLNLRHCQAGVHNQIKLLELATPFCYSSNWNYWHWTSAESTLNKFLACDGTILLPEFQQHSEKYIKPLIESTPTFPDRCELYAGCPPPAQPSYKSLHTPPQPAVALNPRIPPSPFLAIIQLNHLSKSSCPTHRWRCTGSCTGSSCNPEMHLRPNHTTLSHLSPSLTLKHYLDQFIFGFASVVKTFAGHSSLNSTGQ